MASPLVMLGLRPSDNLSLPFPCNAPYFLIFHFLFAYVCLSTRPTKLRLGIDHNANPREDVSKYGEAAVKSGKITQSQLAFLKRNEACHANSVEHYPVFVAAVLMSVLAGVPNQTVNFGCTLYTVARLVYAIAYLAVDRGMLTYVRSVAWWVGNGTCIWILMESGKALNRK